MPRTLTQKLHETARTELLTALRQDRSEALLGAMVAGCAIIAYADGEAVSAERDKAFMLIQGNPLLFMFSPDAVLRAFRTHERAFREDAPAARVAALRLVEPLACEPEHARKVLNACLMLTGADGRMHPREITAIKQVRDALGLSPGRRRTSRVAVLVLVLAAGSAASGSALAATSPQPAATDGLRVAAPVGASPFALDAPAGDAFREIMERLRASVALQSVGDPDHDFVSGATATLRSTTELAQYVLHYGHDPELRHLARSAIAENQKHLAQMRRWQARHGEKHVQ